MQEHNDNPQQTRQGKDINISSKEFPVDVFPEGLQRIVYETNTKLGFPIDFIGASLLFAVSTATGNRCRIIVKNGWIESAVLYMALVGFPGTNKSHPLHFALQPIMDHDAENFKYYCRQKHDYDLMIKNKRKERDKNSNDTAANEVGDKPFWKQILLTDYTMEALLNVHVHNALGIGVYSDELAAWFKNFNRYNNGSEAERWLSNWSNKPIPVNRKSDEPVFIQRPFITVGGTIQPSILDELVKYDLTDNGFIDRILFVMPSALKKTYFNEDEISTNIIDEWHKIIKDILDLCELKELRFSYEAREHFQAWQHLNTDKCNSAPNESIAGIYAKMENYCIRLSLILEVIYWATDDERPLAGISQKSVEGAIKLVDYFTDSALRVNKVINDPLARLPLDKRQLYIALPAIFKTGQYLAISEKWNIPKRTAELFLSDEFYFIWLKQGEYQKRYQ